MYLSWPIKTKFITGLLFDRHFLFLCKTFQRSFFLSVCPTYNHIKGILICFRFFDWLDHPILAKRISSLHKFRNKSTTSSKSPINCFYWKHTSHFSDYSRDSGTGKFVRFTNAALLFVPIGFLPYMTTI